MIGLNNKMLARYEFFCDFQYTPIKGPSTQAGKEDFACKVTNTEIIKTNIPSDRLIVRKSKECLSCKEDKNYLNNFQDKTK